MRVFLVKNNGIATLIRRAVSERYRPIGYLTGLVRQQTADRVRLGPFTGMRYVSRSIGSAHLPKLLGTYERELQPVIEQACSARPNLIIDLGAAEGYYAVGLALRNPGARVIAFERDFAARRALAQMSLLNGVQARIEIRGEARPADLDAALRLRPKPATPPSRARPFVLCDVEGDEKFLLDPAEVPILKSASLLVETHEFVRPGITRLLVNRFTATHRIEQIWQSPRSGAEFPFRTIGTFLLPNAYLDWAMSEWRPIRMSWLWMMPND